VPGATEAAAAPGAAEVEVEPLLELLPPQAARAARLTAPSPVEVRKRRRLLRRSGPAVAERAGLGWVIVSPRVANGWIEHAETLGRGR
jgi:hypothetical protein